MPRPAPFDKGLCCAAMTPPDPDDRALEPPGLENLRLDADEIARGTGMVDSYVKNEERAPVAEETPFMADTPFGTGPGIVGGETPFFLQNDTAGYDFEMDDTDGIPTGLPDLHDLARYPTEWTPPEEEETLTEIEIVEKVRVERVTDTKAVVRAEQSGLQRALIAFAAGVFASSLLWGVLLWLLERG